MQDIRILQINAQSVKTVDNLKNKIVQLKTLVALKKPDVVSICETWLNDTVKSELFFDENDFRYMNGGV